MDQSLVQNQGICLTLSSYWQTPLDLWFANCLEWWSHLSHSHWNFHIGHIHFPVKTKITLLKLSSKLISGVIKINVFSVKTTANRTLLQSFKQNVSVEWILDYSGSLTMCWGCRMMRTVVLRSHKTVSPMSVSITRYIPIVLSIKLICGPLVVLETFKVLSESSSTVFFKYAREIKK